jgi:hypothetical protein
LLEVANEVLEARNEALLKLIVHSIFYLKLACNRRPKVEDNLANQTPEMLHSVDEAAGILRRSHWWVRWLIRHGRLRPTRVGRRLFVSSTELLRALGKERAKKRRR